MSILINLNYCLFLSPYIYVFLIWSVCCLMHASRARCLCGLSCSPGLTYPVSPCIPGMFVYIKLSFTPVTGRHGGRGEDVCWMSLSKWFSRRGVSHDSVKVKPVVKGEHWSLHTLLLKLKKLVYPTWLCLEWFFRMLCFFNVCPLTGVFTCNALV